jgi:hypothetical protein
MGRGEKRREQERWEEERREGGDLVRRLLESGTHRACHVQRALSIDSHQQLEQLAAVRRAGCRLEAQERIERTSARGDVGGSEHVREIVRIARAHLLTRG